MKVAARRNTASASANTSTLSPGTRSPYPCNGRAVKRRVVGAVCAALVVLALPGTVSADHVSATFAVSAKLGQRVANSWQVESLSDSQTPWPEDSARGRGSGAAPDAAPPAYPLRGASPISASDGALDRDRWEVVKLAAEHDVLEVHANGVAWFAAVQLDPDRSSRPLARGRELVCRSSASRAKRSTPRGSV